MQRDLFFAGFGDVINKLILSHRHELTRIACEQALATHDRSQILPQFQIARSDHDPKGRWVDGTPEYSLYIYGLRKLFPEAVFIHLVRGVTEVVRSIFHFGRVAQTALAQNEQQGYEYWLRTVRACLQAEQAYGSSVVYRVLHSDLVAHSEHTIRSILTFLGEPYEIACLEPLQQRINSSQVPEQFELCDTATDQNVIEAAHAIERELIDRTMPIAPSAGAAAELEAEFQKQVHHVQNVHRYHAQALHRIAKLEEEVSRSVSQSRHQASFWRRWRGCKQR